MDSALKPIENYLQKMQKIQYSLSETINACQDIEIMYQEFINLLNKLKIRDNCYELKSFLYLLTKKYNDYHLQPQKMKIIEKILIEIKDDILKHFQNFEIYSIFKKDKKIILFLLQSKMIFIDNYVLNHLKDREELIFFFPEVRNYLKKDEITKIEEQIPKNFEENDSYLCELIRNDSIENFVTFIAQTNYSLSRQIDESYFETNPFLINKKPTLIEYATYFGSMQIFQYLIQNKIDLKESLWIYAINGNSTEIINILEENKIEPLIKSYQKLFKESIKCHHNDVANYIQENFFQNEEVSLDSKFYFKYFNFEYIKVEFVNKSNFIHFCHYDHPLFVDMLLKYEDIDINEKYIENNNDENGFDYSTEFSAIHIATTYDNIEIVKLLLSYENIDVESTFRDYFVSMLIICINNIEVLSYRKLSISTTILVFISLIMAFFKISAIKIAISAIIFFLYLVLYPSYSYSLCFLPLISFKSSFFNNYVTFNYNERTLLHIAILNDNYEMAKLLLSSNKNIDVNAIYNEIDENWAIKKIPALVLASMRNDDEIVKLLLSNSNTDVNCIFEYKVPYKISFLGLILSFIQFIFSNQYIFFSIYILFCIILNISLNHYILNILAGIVIGVILSAIIIHSDLATSIINDKIPLILMFGQILMYIITIILLIELLLTLLYHIYEKKTSLHIAIQNDNVKIVNLLLERNDIDLNVRYMKKEDNFNFEDYQSNKLTFYDISYYNKTALNMALSHDNVDILKLLLTKSNIDVNTENVFITYKMLFKLEMAYFNILIMIESLISQAFFGSNERQKTLNIAALNTNAEVIKYLLEKTPINTITSEYEKLKIQKDINESEKTVHEDHKEDFEKLDKNLDLIQQFIAENQH